MGTFWAEREESPVNRTDNKFKVSREGEFQRMRQTRGELQGREAPGGSSAL